MSRGTDVIIGTPGRIKECLEKRYTVLNQCLYVILDEADLMIDMGFEEDVKHILDAIPVSMKADTEAEQAVQLEEMLQGLKTYRITQMYSATMPQSLEKLAKKYPIRSNAAVICAVLSS